MDGSVTYDTVIMSLSCTASEINGRTLQNFPSDPVLTPWLRELPWNSVTVVALQI